MLVGPFFPAWHTQFALPALYESFTKIAFSRPALDHTIGSAPHDFPDFIAFWLPLQSWSHNLIVLGGLATQLCADRMDGQNIETGLFSPGLQTSSSIYGLQGGKSTFPGGDRVSFQRSRTCCKNRHGGVRPGSPFEVVEEPAAVVLRAPVVYGGPPLSDIQEQGC